MTLSVTHTVQNVVKLSVVFAGCHLLNVIRLNVVRLSVVGYNFFPSLLKVIETAHNLADYITLVISVIESIGS